MIHNHSFDDFETLVLDKKIETLERVTFVTICNLVIISVIIFTFMVINNIMIFVCMDVIKKTCTFKKEVYKGKSCRVHGQRVKSSYNEKFKTVK